MNSATGTFFELLFLILNSTQLNKNPKNPILSKFIENEILIKFIIDVKI